MYTPHVILQIQPIRRKVTVNSCEIPTKMFVQHGPMGSSFLFFCCCEEPLQHIMLMPASIVPVWGERVKGECEKNNSI